MTESGVISKTALVYGQMNEPPGARLRVGLSGLTMAEYFRDERSQDVLLFIDNIFRFVQAGSEVSALLGRMPSAVGYQPTLATEMGQLQERITSTSQGLDHLGAGHLRARRRPDRPGARHGVRPPRRDDGALAGDLREGHLPGRRPARLDVADPRAGRRRRGALPDGARGCRRCSSATRISQDIIAILGMDELSEDDKVDRPARAQDRALPEPAVPRRRAVHRHARQVREARGHDPRASRRSSTASTTTCPSRRSTWSAPIEDVIEAAEKMKTAA